MGCGLRFDVLKCIEHQADGPFRRARGLVAVRTPEPESDNLRDLSGEGATRHIRIQMTLAEQKKLWLAVAGNAVMILFCIGMSLARSHLVGAAVMSWFLVVVVVVGYKLGHFEEITIDGASLTRRRGLWRFHRDVTVALSDITRWELAGPRRVSKLKRLFVRLRDGRAIRLGVFAGGSDFYRERALEWLKDHLERGVAVAMGRAHPP